MNFIAENKKYKVYSIYENIYLKDKSVSNDLEDFSKKDELIGWHYGDPNDGIITEDYVIISGCGITIYDLKNKIERHLLIDEDNRFWTNGVHQEGGDCQNEFRFVSENSDNRVRIFKMNIETEVFIELG